MISIEWWKKSCTKVQVTSPLSIHVRAPQKVTKLNGCGHTLSSTSEQRLIKRNCPITQYLMNKWLFSSSEQRLLYKVLSYLKEYWWDGRYCIYSWNQYTQYFTNMACLWCDLYWHQLLSLETGHVSVQIAEIFRWKFLNLPINW